MYVITLENLLRSRPIFIAFVQPDSCILDLCIVIIIPSKQFRDKHSMLIRVEVASQIYNNVSPGV